MTETFEQEHLEANVPLLPPYDEPPTLDFWDSWEVLRRVLDFARARRVGHGRCSAAY